MYLEILIVNGFSDSPSFTACTIPFRRIPDVRTTKRYVDDPAYSYLMIVDLSALKLAAVIDIDSFPLREEIVYRPTAFTVAVSRLFYTAKW